MKIIIIRGAGDLASGVIQKFHRIGFNIVVLETEKPSFIRKQVSFGMAIFEKNFSLEGSISTFIGNIDELKNDRVLSKQLQDCFFKNEIPIIIDPNMDILGLIKHKYQDEIEILGIIDAIIAKKNLGMNLSLAPITIALGPGFSAGEDVNIVIETMRGHNLGKLIFQGKALENTGVPGMIGGESLLRVIYSEFEGELTIRKDIGSIVEKGEIIAYVGENPVRATISGLLRGMITSGFFVKKGLKIADVDPRVNEYQNTFSISDKARALGGAALEAFLILRRELDK